MSVVVVIEKGQRHLFLCSPCAISFYNSDREVRSAPDWTDPREGEAVRTCEKEASHG